MCFIISFWYIFLAFVARFASTQHWLPQEIKILPGFELFTRLGSVSGWIGTVLICFSATFGMSNTHCTASSYQGSTRRELRKCRSFATLRKFVRDDQTKLAMRMEEISSREIIRGTLVCNPQSLDRAITPGCYDNIQVLYLLSTRYIRLRSCDSGFWNKSIESENRNNIRSTTRLDNIRMERKARQFSPKSFTLQV